MAVSVIGELEWRRVGAGLTDTERDAGVTDLIDLVVAIDGVLQEQATADSDYFLGALQRPEHQCVHSLPQGPDRAVGEA